MERLRVWRWVWPGGDALLGTEGVGAVIVVERSPGAGVLDRSRVVPRAEVDREVEAVWDRLVVVGGRPDGPRAVDVPARRVVGLPAGWVVWMVVPAVDRVFGGVLV